MIEALGPALRLAAMELAEQAAAEVRAQLPGHTRGRASWSTAIRRCGSPRPPPAPPRTEGEDFVSRLTLRLPPSLKELVENAADRAGESVNAWVVDALGRGASKGTKPGREITESFEL